MSYIFNFCIETAKVFVPKLVFFFNFFLFIIFITSRTPLEISLRALWAILVNNVSIFVNSAFIKICDIFCAIVYHSITIFIMKKFKL